MRDIRSIELGYSRNELHHRGCVKNVNDVYDGDDDGGASCFFDGVKTMKMWMIFHYFAASSAITTRSVMQHKRCHTMKKGYMMAVVGR